MYDTARPPRRPAKRRGGLAVLLVALAVMVAGTGVFLVLNDDSVTAAWRLAPASAGRTQPTTEPTPEAPESITLSATGDIVMGDAPGQLPPNNGAGFFDHVRDALAADLVMGNLEEPLTDDTGYGKCGAQSTGCHQFRVPPSYAGLLKGAGFHLLNLANNHAYDFGEQGNLNTRKTLEEQGLAHTGAPEQITVVDVKGVKVAVLGFSSYSWSNSLVNLDQAKRVVAKAATMADLVVVQVHMGAEGADRSHVRPGTEMFLGENRGDPIKFSHTVIDAGADLVVGHGPHVLRGMEFYEGRLIAYSLGNFCGGAGTLNSSGNLGLSGVLKVTLRADGTWAGGSLTSTTHQGGGGLPRMDSRNRGAALVKSVSTADFPKTGARLSATGDITPPS